jgi:hypothetical protein
MRVNSKANQREQKGGAICAGCRQPVAQGEGQSWVFLRMISRSVTTIWLCEPCAPQDASKCAVCASHAPMGRLPICTECLFEYEEIIGAK